MPRIIRWFEVRVHPRACTCSLDSSTSAKYSHFIRGTRVSTPPPPPVNTVIFFSFPEETEPFRVHLFLTPNLGASWINCSTCRSEVVGNGQLNTRELGDFFFWFPGFRTRVLRTNFRRFNLRTTDSKQRYKNYVRKRL